MVAGWFATGAALAAAGVVLGAFGAHGLKGGVDPEALVVFETGVRYHLVHAIAMLASSWAVARWPNGWTGAAGWLFLIGIVVFSGSLYLLSMSGPRWLGAVTPVGGLAFIAGWLCLVAGALKGS